MYVLALNATSRRNGMIDRMLNIAVNKLNEMKSHIEIIYVNELNIKPCIGCMKCRVSGKCVLPEDDGHVIGEKLNSCDAIIVATPVYWGNITGQLKLLFDRNVYNMMSENKFGFPIPKQKGKKSIVLTACTTNKIGDFFAGESKGAHRAIKEIMHYSGVKIVGYVNKNNTKINREISGNIEKRIERLCSKL